MPTLPTGTVTFLFTDIEGSTRLWEQHPDAMRAALRQHDGILRTGIEAHGGFVFKTVGDAFYAAFASAVDALAAALATQRELNTTAWIDMGPLRVRMALHTGMADIRDGDYFGPALNRIARLLSAGHGSQVLLSEAARERVRDQLPVGTSLRDLGRHRLKDLTHPEQIFQLVASDLPADFPPLKTLPLRPTNLPARLTPLIGREREVEAIWAQLARPEVRLLTLTGPAGTGKTSLASAVAAAFLDDPARVLADSGAQAFAGGIFFVPLAAIVDPGLLATSIATALGVPEAPGEPLWQTLQAHLHDREILLLLDNFEQLIAAAPLVVELLASTTHLKALVTSRERLAVRGEHEFPISPLPFPQPEEIAGEGLGAASALSQYAAVRLFVERARAVKPDFAITDENAPALAEICARLDGLPLAIELAAARARLLAPQAMLARLPAHGEWGPKRSALRLLTAGARDLPARQQTLRGAIAWSYDLLSPAEQTLFRRLAVFVGGRTAEAVEAVAGDWRVEIGDSSRASSNLQSPISILDGLASLVDKSLVRQEEQADGEPRFVMLKTIHEYALECLEASGEAATLRRAHAEYYLALAEEAEAQLTGPDQARWLERLETEHGNLRAALQWAEESREAAHGLRLAAALWRFWHVRGHASEGRERLRRAISLAGNSAATPVWVQALMGAGVLAEQQGDYGEAEALLEQRLRLSRELGDLQGVAAGLNSLGVVALKRGDDARATKLLEQSLALKRDLGDKGGAAISLTNLGIIAVGEMDYARGKALFEQALALARELQDAIGIALLLTDLGEVMRELGDDAQARRLLEEAVALLGELGEKDGLAHALVSLGDVRAHEGDSGAAEQLYRESLALFHAIGEKHGMAYVLESLARLAQRQEEPERAVQLLGVAEALRSAVAAPRTLRERTRFERIVTTLRAQLDDTRFTAAWDSGHRLTLDQAIAYALNQD